MTVDDLANYALGQVERLPYPAALDIVKRTWEEVRSAVNWNWLTRFGQLLIPEAVTTGTVSVAQFQTAVTFNAAAVTALNASVTATSIPIVGRAFRAGSGVGNDVGSPYLITAYDSGTGVATLDRAYRDDTNATATYSVYKPLHTPPFGTDFVRFTSPTDVTEGYPLKTDFTKADIDRRDPQRASTGNPYIVAFWGMDPVTRTLPLYELWPHPTTAKVLDLWVVTRGLTDFSTNLRAFPHPQFVFPPLLDDEVLKHKAAYHTFIWAEGHKGKFDELKGVTWRFLWQNAEKDYENAKNRARRKDRETAPKIIPPPGARQLTSPVDAAFWQSHDIVS